MATQTMLQHSALGDPASISWRHSAWSKWWQWWTTEVRKESGAYCNQWRRTKMSVDI